MSFKEYPLFENQAPVSNVKRLEMNHEKFNPVV